MVTAACPAREVLLQYSIGTLSDEQSDDLARHLDSCPDCQATIITLEDAEDTLIGRLRMPLGSESCLAEPEFHAAVAHAIATPSSPGVSPVLPDHEPNPASVMPQMLGEYRILEELGHGGMGRVYKALHTKLDRLVAIKVLARARLEDPQAIARFEREMKAVGRLAHPNIVQAYDAREIEGTPVLIMEFVDGLDLAELVRRVGPLPVAEACELVRQTALGLQRAHENGLVHRDIKPSNLMLTGLPSPVRGRGAGGEGSQPQVKILDLGLALLKGDQPGGLAPDTPHALLQSPIPNPQSPSSPPTTHHPPPAEDLTGAQQVMGTVSYMAPEQAGDAHQVDIRADIYSLGCTLYKLLSGRPPFPGRHFSAGGLAPFSPHQAPLQPSTSPAKKVPDPFAPAPIRQLRPEVPDALAAVLDRMLAKDPADRFATPAEVAEALEPFATTSDLASLTGGLSQFSRSENGTVPFPHGTVPFWRRTGPRRVAVAAGGAAAAILFGILFTVSTGKGTVQLEFADAEAARQCKISIDGDDIRIENLGEPIKLRPGKHELRILHGDLEIETREFDVVRHGVHVLHVSIPEPYAPGAKGESEISVLQDSAADLMKFSEANPKHYGAHRELFDTYYKLGEVLYSRGRTAEAKAAFENAYPHGFAFIELRPDNEPQSEASCRRYVVNLMSDCPIAEVRNPDKLIELAKQADAMEPGMNSFLSLGLAYYRAGQWRQAVANLEEWSTRHAGPANSYRGYFLAMAYWHLGRKDEARRCFHEVDGRYVVPASRPTASRYRAEAAQLLGIAEKPTDASRARYFYDCGFDDAEAGYYDKAAAEFSQAIELTPVDAQLTPDDARYWIVRATAEAGGGKLDAYRKHCAEMLRHFGQKDEIAYGACWRVASACILAPDAVADWPTAIAFADKLVTAFPGNGHYAHIRGAVLYRAGRLEESIVQNIVADRLLEDSDAVATARTRAFLAMAHHRLGHRDEAKKWFEKMSQQAEKVLNRKPRVGWNQLVPLRLSVDEARQLLGITDKPPTVKEKPGIPR